MSTYDRNKAAEYARKYAISPNSEYHKFDNDCTNFVSQALFVGGWPMIQGDKKMSTSWYYDKGAWFPGLISPASYTWGGASNFHAFLTWSRRAELVDGASKLGVGDVVQMSNGGQIHHTMIVTAGGSDLKLSYHTTNKLDEPLSKIVANSPGETFIYWKLRNSY